MIKDWIPFNPVACLGHMISNGRSFEMFHFPVMWLTFCFPNIAIITIPAASLKNNFKGAAGPVLNKARTCPKLNGVWYYEPRDFNSDCKQSLSFCSPREVRLDEHAIERRTTSGAFFFKVKPTIYRTLQCHQSTSDHFLDKNAIVVGILRFKKDIFPFIDQS